MAVGEQEFAHGVAVDPAAKRLPAFVARRQEVDHPNHTVAPRQQLLLDGQRANVKTLVRDFESLGRIQDDGQILEVCLDGGHGEDLVDQMVWQGGSAVSRPNVTWTPRPLA
ncbi:hypothetical protein [Paraburkholderia sp. GAS33]|uniref:hypothetical protein n=1 Tax=Paraburkholderia sp. GAS33 TaxID=3035130 RepID=UPI003D252180